MKYDVIIIGSGIVGLVCGLALAREGKSIAIMDRHMDAGDFQKEHYDIRVSAITQASQQVFQGLSAWKGMQDRRISPYRHMQVWDAKGSGEIHFSSMALAQPVLGYIIENNVIRAALLEQVAKAPGLTLIAPIELTQVETEENQVTLKDKAGETYSSDLVIGADGGRSWLRQQVGIEWQEEDYGHHAMVATVKTAKPHEETAWQHFLPEGPLAFLPLEDPNHCSIVWSSTPEHIESLKQLSREAFNEVLTKAYDNRLGEVECLGQPASFPLAMRHVKQYVMPRIALIGDAAHTIHPLAGQGLNLGIMDAASLTEVIHKVWKRGFDPGLQANLRPYERWRKGHNSAMIAAMSGFKKLFTTESKPLQRIRNLGLSITNDVTPLKNRIARLAMGLEGDLPELAKLKMDK